jgi:hypothetical protein
MWKEIKSKVAEKEDKNWKKRNGCYCDTSGL